MTTEQRHGFTQDDLDRMRFIEAADLSPDGKLAVYAQFTTDPKAERDHSALWLVDVESGHSRRLTAGTGKDSWPAFSPDGTEIAFVSDRTGKNQIHVIPVDGGEARQVTALEQGVTTPPVWSPEGGRIAFTAGPQGEPRDRSRPYRITRAIYRFDMLGYIDDVKQDLWVVPAAGGEAKQVTTDARMNTNPRWTPRGDALVYTSGFEPADRLFWPRVRLVDLEGSSSRDLPQPDGAVVAADFTPDGRLAILIGFQTDRPIGSKSELYVSDAELTSVTPRTTTLEWQVGGGFQGDTPPAPFLPRILFLSDGRAVLPVQRGGNAPLFAIALSGPEAFERLTPDGSEDVPLATAGRRVLFASADFDEPGDLFVWEGDGGGERVRRLTRLNEDVLAGCRAASRPRDRRAWRRRGAGGRVVSGARRGFGALPQRALHPRRPPRGLRARLPRRHAAARRCGVRRDPRQPPCLDRLWGRLRDQDSRRLGQPRLSRPDGGRRSSGRDGPRGPRPAGCVRALRRRQPQLLDRRPDQSLQGRGAREPGDELREHVRGRDLGPGSSPRKRAAPRARCPTSTRGCPPSPTRIAAPRPPCSFSASPTCAVLPSSRSSSTRR